MLAEVDLVGVRRSRLLLGVLLLEVVCAEPLVAGLALGQGVGEGVDVAGRLPGLAGQDHAGVEADDVLAGLHHGPPPLALDVVLELDTERAVVPRRPGPAVDLATGVDEPPPLGQRDDAVDDVLRFRGGRLGHGGSSIAVACQSAGCGRAKRPPYRPSVASFTRVPAGARCSARRRVTRTPRARRSPCSAAERRPSSRRSCDSARR